MAWGSNGNGQTTVPTEARSGVVAVAGGRDHSLAPVEITPPGPADFFDADAADGRVSLSWANPQDADFAAVRVLRFTTVSATGPEPSVTQTQVYEGTDESFEDTNVTNGTTYYYTAYSVVRWY